EDLPASLLALAQALSVTERQLHGSLLNMGVVSLICGALFRGSLNEANFISDSILNCILGCNMTSCLRSFPHTQHGSSRTEK
ncbi:hypothetical protein, partial [Xanthomonas hortorum]|uniref:hypothetical protein n=1 Tax=Xanthomonas hortorum TaxID=56454 RepID=UPI001F165BC4